jgi:hypothetical protein
MAQIPKKSFDAPIPGENFTSDTKNYPWHRPADIIKYDEAIEYSLEQLSTAEASHSIMSLLSVDVSLPTVVDIFLTSQISRGKFPIDLAILISGPIARFLEIMAKMYDIEYTMGKDNTPQAVTPAYLKQIMATSEVDEEEAEVVVEDINEALNPTMGLMGAPSQIEQDMMLGQTDLIENEEEPLEETE